MNRYVVDTQCLVWYLGKDRHLPRAARAVFDSAKEGRVQILVPSIVLVETLFLVQRQRISEAIADELILLPETSDSAIYVVPLDMSVVRSMRDFGPAAVAEMADRVIAATARSLSLPLLTVDHAIAASGLVEVIG